MTGDKPAYTRWASACTATAPDSSEDGLCDSPLLSHTCDTSSLAQEGSRGSPLWNSNYTLVAIASGEDAQELTNIATALQGPLVDAVRIASLSHTARLSPPAGRLVGPSPRPPPYPNPSPNPSPSSSPSNTCTNPSAPVYCSASNRCFVSVGRPVHQAFHMHCMGTWMRARRVYSVGGQALML